MLQYAKLRLAHKLQTISDAFSHIASRFLKVALAIKFALNWLAGPQCVGGRCDLSPGVPDLLSCPGPAQCSGRRRPRALSTPCWRVSRSRPADYPEINTPSLRVGPIPVSLPPLPSLLPPDGSSTGFRLDAARTGQIYPCGRQRFQNSSKKHIKCDRYSYCQRGFELGR